MPETSDREALMLLARGDSRGFDLAYASYSERVFAFLVRLSGSRALAEDLFQHTFMRLAEVGPRLRLDSDLRAWLFTVARNAFHSHARSRSVAGRFDVELAERHETVTTPEASLTLTEFANAFSTLRASDRELLLLFGAEGLSYAEVAAILGLDQVTVRKRVSRARVRLTEALDGDTTVVSKSGVNG
jgi:RNA polymerase sigma-70 factor (ECF subfamily)